MQLIPILVTSIGLGLRCLAANMPTLIRRTCDNLALQEVLSLLMRCLAYLLLDKAMLRQRNIPSLYADFAANDLK